MAQGLHLSTLVQQLLSSIAQYGGMTAGQAWTLLCETGPFIGLSKSEFSSLLKCLGEQEVLIQDPSGLLLFGPLGEKLAGHYSFYAAFATEEEFRLVAEGKTLGSLPVSRPLEINSHVIFAGRRWRVCNIDLSAKVIEVVSDKGGKPPAFDGMGGSVHDRIREEMRHVLAEDDLVPFLDQKAMALLTEARENFRRLGLFKLTILPSAGGMRIFPWKGDCIMDTLALALKHHGLRAENEGICLFIRGIEPQRLSDLLFDITGDAFPNEIELADSILNKLQGKWDWLLPDTLLAKNFASQKLDVVGTNHFISGLMSHDGLPPNQ